MGDVLHHIVEFARRTPDHDAVKDAESSLTYAELEDLAGRVAAAMGARGVAPGDRVVLLLQNSVDYVIAALASLWLGAIFVPLDASDPVNRLSALIRDCQPSLVVTNGVLDESALPDDVASTPFVRVSQLRNEQAPSVERLPGEERPSYIIYTSGTTGKPKGVVIGSGAFEAAVTACSTARGLDSTTRTLSVSPFHFDGSFATLFTTLASGGTLILRPRESLLFARVFFNTVIAEEVTYTGFTPSYFRLLASSPQFEMLTTSKLDVVAMGGESLTLGDVERLWEVVPQVRIFNGYGPTETAITASQKELTRSAVSQGVITIGRPNAGVRFYLVDEENRLVEASHVPAELYIGGHQVMDGYWASPDLTDQVIRSDLVEGERLYKTGDIVYRDDFGEYVYVSRADRVIKRSGVRISLAEISDTLCNDDGVRTATTLVFDNDGGVGVVSFVVTTSSVTVEQLLRGARALLPPTMLPDRIEIVDSMPLTSSGKTDERKLLSDAGLRSWSPVHVEPGK